MELPTINNYGNYSSSNYGAHSLVVTISGVTVWFSYSTPIAFQDPEGNRVVRQNDWGPTTGKHLNWIDGGDKAARVTGQEFERLYAELVEGVTA